MFLSKFYINVLYALICILFSIYSSEAKINIPKDRVMSIEEFKNAINNDEFLKYKNLTTFDIPLTEFENELIEIALLSQKKSYGGVFQPGREIDKFTGSTLLVGGGKTA